MEVDKEMLKGKDGQEIESVGHYSNYRSCWKNYTCYLLSKNGRYHLFR